MTLRWAVRLAWAVVLVLGAQAVPGQTLPQSSDEALLAMEQMADVIFAGHVIAVRRHAGNDGATGVVEIQFAVEDAVRGVSGGSYTLREWAGSWPAGDEPFRVGQRLLMLLHAPSAAGLSSPVGGMDGAIPIHEGSAVTAQGDARVVDLGWVQTRVVRPLAYRAESVARPIAVLGGVPANLTHARTENLAEAPESLGQAGPSAFIEELPSTARPSEAYPAVLGKLRGWARSDHASR